MNVKTVIDEGKSFKENDLGHTPIEEGHSPSTKQESGSQKMGSQIDVKIRVSSNLNVSTTGGESTMDSAPDSSRSVVNIKLTSQENLNVSQQDESVYSFNQSTNEEVQLENDGEEQKEGPIDEESEDAVHPHEEEDENRPDDSDGDNSVFDDSKEGEGERERPKHVLQLPQQKLSRTHSDTQEEVDDIELIFSSDDHRELHEEEMVSISATYEPWQKQGSSGTPVLLSFEKLSIDDDVHSHKRRQASLDERTERKSSEKTTFLKKCSLDRDNVEPIKPMSLSHSKWQANQKELHVTDISKCGISEENIMDMSRRNTCPNPPVYRPLSRDTNAQPPMRTRNSLSANRCILGGKFTRPGGGGVRGGYLVSAPARGGLRSPLIAITNAGNANECSDRQGPKRSSSVQTDITALPEHWQSESHLAGGGYGNGMFTLPSKFNPMLSSATGRGPRAPLR